MSRSTSTSGSAPTATIKLARSLSLKTTSVTAKPSNVTLFITNLRLLDLDLRPDWPSITTQTFTTQNAQQNQKNRIRCVEWALFRLFELWDVEETRDKLQPFFPPLEPLQSLNLRAALYRSLNELKKNGILGRDSVLRKTMLDECKGDKFMEILVLFSTVVLKKRIGAGKRRGQQEPVVRSLATASMLSTSQQVSLLPLAIAHKSALKAILQKKEERKSRYTHLSELLETKNRSIYQRNEQFIVTLQQEQHSVQPADGISIKRQLRDNWIGNTKWLDIVLHGNDEQAEDSFLNAPFRNVWNTIEKGGSLEEGTNHSGLLETLELRVKQQRTRLQRWQSFHARMAESEMPSSRRTSRTLTKSGIPAKSCEFNAHLSLQPGMLKSTQSDTYKEPAIATSQASQTFKGIVTEMREDISRALQMRRDRTAVQHSHRRRGSLYYFPQSPIKRNKSCSESAPKKTSDLHSAEEFSHTVQSPLPRKFKKPASPATLESVSTPMDSEVTLVGNSAESLPLTSSPSNLNETMPYDEETQPEVSSAALQFAQVHLSAPSPELQAGLNLSSEEHLAEQIISSVGEATPSPVKKPRPSLMERTRMSMAHSGAFQISETLEESPPAIAPPVPEIPDQPALDRRASLLERTRQSMSRISQQPHQKSRRSIVSKPRQSLYPVNQFETPRKQSPIEEKEGDSTPKEYLFSDHADYDHVFKSRPKIAQSPAFTPQHDEELPMTENILDLDDSIIPEEVWGSSPLGRATIIGRSRV